jgi:hypothetical protein
MLNRHAAAEDDLIVVGISKMQTLGVHQPLGDPNRQVLLPSGTGTFQPGILHPGETARERYPPRGSALKKEIPIGR